VSTDGHTHTHTRTDAKRFYYLSHAICYSYGADNDSDCDGSLKGRCYGNRFVARVGENWHTPSSFCAIAFNNGWEYRNVDC